MAVASAPPAARRSATRPRPQLVREAVLLVLGVAVTATAVARGHFFAGGSVAPQVALDGFTAAGLALSLRTGTPNLAVASMASLAQLVFVLLSNQGIAAVAAAGVAVAVASGVGATLGGAVALTGLPAWAVSLCGIAVANVVAYAVGGNTDALGTGTFGTLTLTVAAVVFVAGSLAGGVLWRLPAVRARLSPGAVDTRTPLPRALVGLGGSSALAAVSGVLLAGYTGAAGFTADPAALVTALGAVLLGGVGLNGRRGGVAGTALGVYLLAVISFAGATQGDPYWVRVALPAMFALLVGLFANRVAGSRHAASPVGPHGP